jgi:hypothetical protein
MELFTAEEAFIEARWKRRDFGATDADNVGAVGPLRGELLGLLDVIKQTASEGRTFIDLEKPKPAIWRALEHLGYNFQAFKESDSYVRLHWGPCVATDTYDKEMRERREIGYYTGIGRPFDPV